MNISKVSPQTAPNFTGVTEALAKGLGKVGDSKPMVKNIDKLAKNKNLIPVLSTISSGVTTGLYIYKTLTNDKYSKKEKITLALNQGLTFLASQAIQFTVLGALKKTKNNMVQSFSKAVAQRSGSPCSEALKSGADMAADLFTCTLVNRYISPVAVTPIANKLGDIVLKKGEKKDAKVDTKA